MNIGLIGAGAISHFLLEHLNKDAIGRQRITSIFVRDKEKYKILEQTFGVTLYTELDAFLASNIELVIEAATIEAVQAFIPAVVKHKPVVLISIGALADEQFLQQLYELVEKHQHKIYLPSGAIGGLDLLQNADVLHTVTAVTLTTRKPAQSLGKSALAEAELIFEGTARQAIAQFPKNMNVSIVLALAGLGFDATHVRLMADPHIEQNIHQVDIRGDFGEATYIIKNNPLPQNPKTSYLAAMSILGTLKRLDRTFVIGS